MQGFDKLTTLQDSWITDTTVDVAGATSASKFDASNPSNGVSAEIVPASTPKSGERPQWNNAMKKRKNPLAPLLIPVPLLRSAGDPAAVIAGSALLTSENQRAWQLRANALAVVRDHNLSPTLG